MLFVYEYGPQPKNLKKQALQRQGVMVTNFDK